MVKYSYDAWGNHIAITDGNDNDVSGDPYHIANINPYRYRGYRFDIETGLYYLQSRYYDPEIGRFISMDDTKILMLTQGELLGANLFSYCGNNPVMFIDPTGYEYNNFEVFCKELKWIYFSYSKRSLNANRTAWKITFGSGRFTATGSIYANQLDRFEFYKSMGLRAVKVTKYFTISKLKNKITQIIISGVVTLATIKLSGGSSFIIGTLAGLTVDELQWAPGDYKAIYTRVEVYDGAHRQYISLLTVEYFRKEKDYYNKDIWVKARSAYTLYEDWHDQWIK